MKTLVCGGRIFSSFDFVANFLNGLEIKPTLIISGAQNKVEKIRGEKQRIGADWLAIEYALLKQIPFVGVPAVWFDTNGVYNSKAGTERNTLMLDEWTPDRVVAFPGAYGTLDTVSKARKRGIPVIFAGW